MAIERNYIEYLNGSEELKHIPEYKKGSNPHYAISHQRLETTTPKAKHKIKISKIFSVFKFHKK
jgi:hypothetical protein